MSEYLKNNLIYLRLLKKETQEETASALGFSRSTYANYETGDNRPKSDKLEKIIGHFKVTEKELLYSDLTDGNLIFTDRGPEIREKGNVKGNLTGNLNTQNKEIYQLIGDEITGLVVAEPELTDTRFFAPKVITVDSSGDENVVYVPVKARAGYLLGYGDPEYIEKLPVYRLPGYNNGSYRIFEVDGISMFNTLQDKDRVVTRWQRISEIRDERVYVIVTINDGLLIKRVINRYEEGKIICKSDNNFNGEYPSIVLDIHDIKEVWYVVERWTRQLPGPGEIYKRITHLEAELTLLKHRLDKSG